MKKVVLSVLVLMALLSFAWVVVNRLEGTPPVVDIKLPSQYLKKSYEMSVEVSDTKTGLRQVMVSIVQGGKEKILIEKKYSSPGLNGLVSNNRTRQASFLIPVESWKYGMTDGEAVIRVAVSDYSWRKWGKGNLFRTEKKVIIDSQPPKVKILTRHHNIERGGSGLVIYKLSEENLKSGVRVGDNYFPGHPGMFDDEMIHAAFFALNHEQGPGTQISVVVEDPAGNTTKRGFYHYIRDKKFRSDVLTISDGFLDRKIPDFEMDVSIDDKASGQKNPLIYKFLTINSDIRKKNVDTLLAVPTVSKNRRMWDGKFLRLKGAAKRAGFADRRKYKYQGREIDTATHLGIDLASTSNAVVEAANSGTVIFAGFEGIFGNTVIIDHGFGLCSLYAHLGQMSVDKEDTVEKGQEIGFTGMTGLAGGDHLHFSMIVHNTFVNPVEWWDAAWIKNNITSKIDRIKKAQSE